MAASLFEADLLAARERAGVTIQQIQQDTRIPADVIERFEAGRLLGDPAFNDVYLKAFVQAYASAIGLVPSEVLEAYEMARTGSYQGDLNPDGATTPAAPRAAEPSSVEPETVSVPEAPPQTPEPTKPVTPDPKEALPPVEEQAAVGVPEAEDKTSAPTDQAPAVAALAEAPAEPTATPPPTPPPTARTSTARSGGRTFDRSWGTILGVTVVIVLAVATVLWLLFRDSSPTPDREAELARVDTAQATTPDSAAVEVAPVSSAPRLELPIRVTVVAGGNGLQNFRVTEAPNQRLGHWIEPGNTPTFESSEELTLWGEGANGLDPAEVTLRLQGFEWQPPRGQILRLTPANGQRLLDSLATLRGTP
ncbi:MAG: hypothetical protein HKN04_10810 [Rhodothermaceae bacterium]|nr:hypothetical protein [Rhodothermaceae bacterium]